MEDNYYYQPTPSVGEMLKTKLEKRITDTIINIVIRADGKNVDLMGMAGIITEEVLDILAEVEEELANNESNTPIPSDNSVE